MKEKGHLEIFNFQPRLRSKKFLHLDIYLIIRREEEEKLTPVQIETKAIKHHKSENEQKLPVQTKSLGNIETPKQVRENYLVMFISY